MASRKSLPGGSLGGLSHIVVDVRFLSHVILVGFGLEQELPGTGHLCDFATGHLSGLKLRGYSLWG